MNAVAYCAPMRTEYAELILQQAGLAAEIVEHPYVTGDTVYLTTQPDRAWPTPSVWTAPPA